MDDKNLNDLLNTEDYGDLYEPVAEEETQEPVTNTEQKPSLGQFIQEILTDADYILEPL